MVHDEEAEISIRLDTLIANSQRSRSSIGHLGNPESLPNAAGDAAEGLSDSHQAADAGTLLLTPCHNPLAVAIILAVFIT